MMDGVSGRPVGIDLPVERDSVGFTDWLSEYVEGKVQDDKGIQECGWDAERLMADAVGVGWR